MNFFTVQSINTYTKNMEMQMKWQRKKETGDFTADGSTKLDAVGRQAEEIRKANADGSTKMAKQIDLKLNSGKKLTAEEMEYLQTHDPQKYQRVKQIEAEQKNYENELKRCKTKDEVQQLRMAHTAASLSAVNSIKNNPAIPEEKKLELIMQEHRKNQAFTETTAEFVESGKYAKLSTEEERQKAEKDLKEAEEAEKMPEKPSEEQDAAERKDAGAEADIKAEADRNTETDRKTEADRETGAGWKTEADRETGAGWKAEIKAEADSEDAQMVIDAGSETIRRAEAEAAKRKARAVMEERAMTRAEAETTPEARKVKRARAEAAYKANQGGVSAQAMDITVE